MATTGSDPIASLEAKLRGLVDGLPDDERALLFGVFEQAQSAAPEVEGFEQSQYQQQMANYARMMSMLSSIMQAQHDTAKGIIQNIRA